MLLMHTNQSETTMLPAAISIMKYCQKASGNILDHLGKLDLKLGLISRSCVKRESIEV